MPNSGFIMDALPYSPSVSRAAHKHIDTERITFLDTPGHEAFELHRGRTMAAADAAIVVVSVERGAEVQTEEVLQHAARWRVPILFALNKIDLPGAHVELTRAELRRQCQVLLEEGVVDVDWTREAEEAVPISALHRRRLGPLMRQLCKVLERVPKLPLRPAVPSTVTPGEALSCRHVPRRTDFLVGVEAPPSAVALVLEVERGEEQGEKVLTLIVRRGRLVLGQYFAVGTAFGRITNLAIASGCDGHDWSATETATPGVAVRLMGLRTRQLGGDCAPDDLLFVLPRERAWRLSEHRRRIEELSAIQTAGPPVEVPWEHDPISSGSRTQGNFDRRRDEQPEQHAGSAYQRRWQQAAVEELAPEPQADGREAAARSPPPPIFTSASRRDFRKPFAEGDLLWKESGQEQQEEEEEATPPNIATRGRRSATLRRAHADAPTENSGKAAGRPERRFLVVSPSPEPGSEEAAAEPAPAAASAGGGRRSGQGAAGVLGALRRQPSGAWASPVRAKEEEFIYYTDRATFEEEGSIDSERVRSRWRWRDQARWEEQQRQEALRREERAMAEATRREVFGEPPLAEQAGAEAAAAEPEEEEEEEGDDPAGPLPRRNVPLVPLILKTKTVGHFDVLMDELERLQDQYRVRVVIVHGGLGPVIPKDIIHAEIEKQYGFCPIYAFQVGVQPTARSQAEVERIDIRRFDVFTDLVADVAARCERVHEKARLTNYRESLRARPTASGL